MATITMLDLRNHAKSIIRRIQRGETLLLTYRGKPVVRLSPVETQQAPAVEDYAPLQALIGKAECEPLAEEQRDAEIDGIVYGR